MKYAEIICEKFKQSLISIAKSRVVWKTFVHNSRKSIYFYLSQQKISSDSNKLAYLKVRLS